MHTADYNFKFNPGLNLNCKRVLNHVEGLAVQSLMTGSTGFLKFWMNYQPASDIKLVQILSLESYQRWKAIFEFLFKCYVFWDF